MRPLNIPNWVTDEIIGPAQPHTIRLVLALFRHGSPQVAEDGSRRVYWRGSKQQLARTSWQTKRSVDAAVAELQRRGFLTLHRVTVPSAGIAISAPVDPQGDASFAPFSESENATHDDGDLSPSTNTLFEEEFDASHTTTMTREQLFHALQEKSVTNPSRWLATYDHGRIEGALAVLADLDAADEAKRTSYGEPVRYSITKPAGFLYRLLESKNPLPERFAPATADVATSC